MKERIYNDKLRTFIDLREAIRQQITQINGSSAEKSADQFSLTLLSVNGNGQKDLIF